MKHIWVVVKTMVRPLWGPLNTRCRITLKTPKGDHSFDNHPYACIVRLRALFKWPGRPAAASVACASNPGSGDRVVSWDPKRASKLPSYLGYVRIYMHVYIISVCTYICIHVHIHIHIHTMRT